MAMTNTGPRLIPALLTTSLALLALGTASELVNPLLQYQPDWASSGQFWRLISAHFVHLNLTHTALNLAALWLMMLWLGEQHSILEWILAATLISLTISLGLWLWRPDIDYYVGLSGTLHGLLIYGLAPLCRVKSITAWLVIAAVGGKLIREHICPGASLGTEQLIAGRVITEAHLLGAIGGVVVSILRCADLLKAGKPKQRRESAR